MPGPEGEFSYLDYSTILSFIMSRFSKMQLSSSLVMVFQTLQPSFLHSVFVVHSGCAHDGEEDS
jgi:hypothetical protein